MRKSSTINHGKFKFVIELCSGFRESLGFLDVFALHKFPFELKSINSNIAHCFAQGHNGL